MASQTTLKDALGKFLEHLKAVGKKERTIYTYNKGATVIAVW